MSFLSSLDIAGSGLTAGRMRMDIISENIANAQVTRTENGGPYRRKMVVYEETGNTDSFQHILTSKMSRAGSPGVRVAEVVEDETPFTPVYNPTHPDADANGYVLMPNVDSLQETLDMMAVTRAYDLSLSAVNAIKGMASKALEIGK